jgi:hypothetical protein
MLGLWEQLDSETEERSGMPNLNLDAASTAVLCMDIQQGTTRRSSMFRERNVASAVKSVQEAARKAAYRVRPRGCCAAKRGNKFPSCDLDCHWTLLWGSPH